MDDVQLRIGTFTRSLLIDVARTQEILGQAGLDVRETAVTSSPGQFRSLEAGEFDLVMTSPDNALAYRFLSANPLGRRLPVTIYAAVDRGLGLSLCLAPTLDDVEAVRGNTLGVDVPHSGFAFVAYELLARARLLPGDYSVASLGSTPHRSEVLIAGGCEATVLNAGNELRAQDAGCTTISDVSDLGPYIGTVLSALTTTDPVVEETSRRFADVIVEASQRILAGEWSAEAVDAAVRLLGLSETQAHEHLLRLRDPQHGLIPDGIVDRDSIKTLVDLRRTYLPAPELDTIVDEFGTMVVDRAWDQPSRQHDE